MLLSCTYTEFERSTGLKDWCFFLDLLTKFVYGGLQMSKNGEKSKMPLIIIAVSVVVVIAAIAVIGVMTYFDKINIPFVNDAFVSMGLKDNNKEETKENEKTQDKFTEEDLKTPYEVTPPDADEYFNNNTSLKSEIKATESTDVHSESETYENFSERGFDANLITTEYDMDGEYSKATKISEYSSTKHPMYQAYYISSSGDIWMLFEINGMVVANPLSYNEQKESSVQIMLSEEDTITSYDSTTNKFYVNIPNADVLTVKKVDKIDAETLDKLTYRELDKL